MRKSLALPLLLLTAAAARADIYFDGDSSPWRIASDDRSGRVRTLELVRAGRSFGSSPETLVITRGPGDDAAAAAEAYLEEKQSSCDGGHYEFARSSWDDTVYSWDPRGCDMPDADRDEVGRVFVSGDEVIRLSLRLLDGDRLSKWSRWIASSGVEYSSWSRMVFEGGTSRSAGTGSPSRRGAAVEAPDADSCADDDLDCLLAVQREQVAALEATTRGIGTGERSGSRPSTHQRDRVESDGGDLSCCAVPAARGLHLQRQDPAGQRTGDVTRFLSTDTYIFAVLDLRGDQGGSVATFSWVRVDDDGDEHEVVSRDIDIESGSTMVYGSLYYTGLTPTGRYRVRVYLDGVYAGGRELVVVAGSAFG